MRPGFCLGKDEKDSQSSEAFLASQSSRIRLVFSAFWRSASWMTSIPMCESTSRLECLSSSELQKGHSYKTLKVKFTLGPEHNCSRPTQMGCWNQKKLFLAYYIVLSIRIKLSQFSYHILFKFLPLLGSREVNVLWTFFPSESRV